MTGILAALAVKHVPMLSLKRGRLDQAFARLNQDIKQAAEEAGLDLKFRIRLHPIHQDSTLLQQALTRPHNGTPSAWTTPSSRRSASRSDRTRHRPTWPDCPVRRKCTSGSPPA